MSSKARQILIWVAVIAVVSGGLFIGLRGCMVMPWNTRASGGMVSVSITRDYGRTLVKSGQVKPRKGDSVLDLLKKIARVDTEYGGGFVSAIDGTGSSVRNGKTFDWFYYINGILAESGSAQETVQRGDMVWWDFHAWSSGDFSPSVVGAWPKPFTSGYPDAKHASTMIYAYGFEELARATGETLARGGADIGYAELEQTFKNERGGPVMVFLTPGQAAAAGWIAPLLERAPRSGAFLTVKDNGIVPLDSAGEPVPTGKPPAAAIVSTGKGMGDGAPVWLVLCDGEAGMKAARSLLVTDSHAIELKTGVVIEADGTVRDLPFTKGPVEKP